MISHICHISQILSVRIIFVRINTVGTVFWDFDIVMIHVSICYWLNIFFFKPAVLLFKFKILADTVFYLNESIDWSIFWSLMVPFCLLFRKYCFLIFNKIISRRWFETDKFISFFSTLLSLLKLLCMIILHSTSRSGRVLPSKTWLVLVHALFCQARIYWKIVALISVLRLHLNLRNWIWIITFA